MFYAPAIRAAQFDPPDSTAVSRAVSLLTGDDWRSRRDAVRQLVKIGPPVEAPLRDLLASDPNPEFRLRATEVLRRVGPMRRTEPTLITLDFRDTDPRFAFDQLARIEGAQLPIDPPDLLDRVPQRVTAHFDHEPYWQVVLELVRQLPDLRLRCNETGVALLRPKKPPPPPVFFVSGMFLVTPTWVTGFKEVGPGMRITVYAEPRARVLRGDSPFSLTQAIDASGRSCISESAFNSGGSSVTNGYAWSAGVSPMLTPGSTLKLCKGVARVVAAETYQTLEAPGFDSPKSLSDPMPIRLTSGAVSASVVRCINTGGEYVMDIQINTDPQEVDWDALMFSIRSGGIRTFDITGAELPLLSAQCDGGGPSNYVRCRWSPRTTPSSRSTSPPHKLTWQIPSRTVHLAVPFELHDVTMR